MSRRVRRVAWRKDDPFGVEFAEITLDRGTLAARGHSIGTDPAPYLLRYELETRDGFVTASLRATTAGDGWRRTLDLERDDFARWDAADTVDGRAPFEIARHDVAGVAGALDCDLGLSPVTNSMPVLRHGLLRRAGSVDLLTAWVSVPDLVVGPARQRYAGAAASCPGRVRFESRDDPFAADIGFDADGIVVDYPGIARRL